MTVNDACIQCGQMHPREHPPEVRAEALALLASVGKAEAARRTGVPAGTIASWGVRNGVRSPTVAACARMVEGQAVAWAERKLTMSHELGRLAAKALKRVDERIDHDETKGLRDLAVTAAVFIDKAQLLSGGSTSRIGVIPERTPEQEAEMAKVLEFRQRAS